MKRLISYAWLLSVASLSLWVVGCACKSHHSGSGSGHDLKLDKCAEIPNGSLPDPIGAHVRRFQAVQRDNAVSLEYAVYLHEWYMGGLELGPYGEHHVENIIRRLGTVPYPVVIQPTPDRKTNEARRNIIVAKLLEGGIVDAESRVIIANPAAEGLFGDEAPRIFGQLLQGSAAQGFGQGGLGIGNYGGSFGGLGGAGTFLPPVIGGGGFGAFTRY